MYWYSLLGGGEEQNQSLSVYSPSLSSTYQTVTCKNPLCSSSVVQCLNPSSRTQDQEYCRYEIQYLSPNTSTSGILVQDIMQFMPENSSSSSGSSPQKTTATITFGYELVLVLLVFCFLFFLVLVLLSWYSWPCELSRSSDDMGRRQPDQLSSWCWYIDAVMGMFWSLCNVLVLHDALCCMQVRYKPDRGFCTRFFSFRRASWAGTRRHFSAQHHGQTRSCTELFLDVLCAGWIRKNRVRRQRSSKATQHSAGEDQQPVSFPNTYLPPVYMPTLVPPLLPQPNCL